MDSLNRHFGLIIAYLLPGFVALTGIAPLAPNVAAWLRADQSAGFGAPFYVLLAATEAGMVVSCFRWFLIDRLLTLTGVSAPAFHAQALRESPAAFGFLVEQHYRHYQFFANTLVALLWTCGVYCRLHPAVLLHGWTDLGAVFLAAVLFAGARDALQKFRQRTKRLMMTLDPEPLAGEDDDERN